MTNIPEIEMIELPSFDLGLPSLDLEVQLPEVEALPTINVEPLEIEPVLLSVELPTLGLY